MSKVILSIHFVVAYKTLTAKPKVTYKETVLDKYVFACDFIARNETDLEYKVTWHSGNMMEHGNVTINNHTGSSTWMVDLEGIKHGVS